MIAADGDVPTFRMLYEETDYAEVWEMIGLQKAANFTPPPQQAEQKPGRIR